MIATAVGSGAGVAGSVIRSPPTAIRPAARCSLVLCVAQFDLILDVAVVNVALVPLAGDLGWLPTGWLQVVASRWISFPRSSYCVSTPTTGHDSCADPAGNGTTPPISVRAAAGRDPGHGLRAG